LLLVESFYGDDGCRAREREGEEGIRRLKTRYETLR